MAIPFLSLISNLCKARPKHSTGEIHLMLAGMNQEIFLRQWGMPEIGISANNLQEFFRLDFLSSDSDPFQNDPLNVWIYEKMDMFVLFRKGKLIAHFKWSEFKERFNNRKVRIDSETQKPSPLMGTTVATT
jgi:hypothetical protein